MRRWCLLRRGLQVPRGVQPRHVLLVVVSCAGRPVRRGVLLHPGRQHFDAQWRRQRLWPHRRRVSRGELLPAGLRAATTVSGREILRGSRQHCLQRVCTVHGRCARVVLRVWRVVRNGLLHRYPPCSVLTFVVCTCLPTTAPGYCYSGYYCPDVGTAVPTLGCTAGFYCPLGTQFPSLPCPTGSYCPNNSAIASPCAAGTYQSAQAQASCTQCPAGSCRRATAVL